MAGSRRHYGTREEYGDNIETLIAGVSLAASLSKRVTRLPQSSAYAATLAAPKFIDQEKYFVSIAWAANAQTLTVTGMDNPTNDVFTFAATASATTPRTLLLKSYDGVSWSIVSMVNVTVA